MNEVHDSDCAQHNEPAFANGPCSCSVKRKSFEDVVKPVMKWLNDNCHPHMIAVIDPTNAQLFEGQISVNTFEFVKD